METMNYMNNKLSPEERASLLLQEMSLEEKMAQVNCVFPFDKTYLNCDWIKEQVPYGIGEVSTLEMRRIKSLQEAADWQRRVQRIVMENSPHGIPAIFIWRDYVEHFYKKQQVIHRGLREEPDLIRSWKKRLEQVWQSRRPPAGSHIFWHRF